MIARNRIWEELKQAKTNILCLQKYTDKRRANNRYYNGFVAVTASAGALGSAVDQRIAVYTSIAIGLVSIIKSVMPNFLQTEPELSELDNLSDFYVRYMNSLEKIWYNHEHNHIGEKETMTCFFELKESECDKESTMNKGVRNISRKFQKEIETAAGDYINKVYFEKYPNTEKDGKN